MNGGAKSLLSLSPGSSLSLSYGSQFGSHDDLLLLEVDDGLLQEILQKGYTFLFFLNNTIDVGLIFFQLNPFLREILENVSVGFIRELFLLLLGLQYEVN